MLLSGSQTSIANCEEVQLEGHQRVIYSGLIIKHVWLCGVTQINLKVNHGTQCYNRKMSANTKPERFGVLW